MTATIRLPDTAASVRKCLRDRYADYATGLEFWINHPDNRISGIVFCDNSGADFSPLASIDAVKNSRRRIEWIQTNCNERPPSVHYGYSELGLIDDVLTQSRLVSGASHFVKATGRFTFPKFSKLIDPFDNDVNVVIDFRRAYRNEGGEPARARTQLAIFSKEFYKRTIFGRREEMIGRCSHIEEYLAYKLLPFRNDKSVVLRFPVECCPSGIEGGRGTDYDWPSNHLKSNIRGVSRKLLPWLWL